MANSYCKAVKNLDKRDVNRLYHDLTYGFPLTDDNELFGRLIMEINQAGLSWTTIWKTEKFQARLRRIQHSKNRPY